MPSGSIFRLMATTMRDAIEELLQTYGETGGINYLAAAASLPSRLSIEAACTELMSLMFPGFRSQALVSSEDLADTTRIRVRHLHARLKTEICRSLGKIPADEATEAVGPPAFVIETGLAKVHPLASVILQV